MTETQMIGEEMAAAVGMDPLVAVALIQAVMQVLMWKCRKEPLTPEQRMLHLANHNPRRLKGHVRRQCRKLGVSEAHTSKVKDWIVPAIKKSSLETRKALCAEASDAAVPA